MRFFRHLLTVSAGIFLFLGIPAIRYVDFNALLSGAADAVSGASVEPPGQPSGEYLVLLNRKGHEESIEEWRDFFQERPVGVIMEDLRCMTPLADIQGQQLADRYRLRLAENQMTVKPMDGILLVSRAENGLFDVIVLSKEMADYYDYSDVMKRPDVEVIPVTGGKETI